MIITILAGPTHNRTVICSERTLIVLQRFEENDGFRYCTHLILEGIADQTRKYQINDKQFDQSEPLLLEMSKHLDFMHISKKSKINGSIKIGVPSTKITIQQELDYTWYNPGIFNNNIVLPLFNLCVGFKKENELSANEYGRRWKTM